MPDHDSLTIEGRPYGAGSGGAHAERIYANEGNPPLIELLGGDCGRILDVGCGAGDNARVIRRKFAHLEIHGITHSQAEAGLAAPYLASCRVFDIEGDLPPDFAGMSFDVLIFSHVLEHLRDPALVLRRFSRLLRQHGAVLIAVPNTLSWATRWRFLRGDFEYTQDGVLDDTHLRFFTYFTADKYLLSKTPGLRLTSKTVSGNVPLWLLRRYVLPGNWSASLDELGCRLWPNLFGSQVLIRAVLDG
jgi:SAM-dependent methyltransferase